MPSVFVSLFLFASLRRKHKLSLFSNAQTFCDTFSPSLLASLMEDIEEPGLTDPDETTSYISDELEKTHSQKQQLKLFHLTCHIRETMGFLGVHYCVSNTLKFKKAPTHYCRIHCNISEFCYFVTFVSINPKLISLWIFIN